MSDEAVATNSDSEDTRSATDPETRDWLLQAFVDEANALNGEFVGITLNVGGTIISGTLVGVSEYMKILSKSFSSDEPEPGTWAYWLLDQSKEMTYKEGDSPQPASFIHLKDARVHLNGQRAMPSNEGILWRGPLDSVDGFWIGRLVPAGPA